MVPHLFFTLLYSAVVAGLASSFWMMNACSHGTVRLLKRQLYHQALALFFVDIMIGTVMTCVLVSSNVDGDCLGDPSIHRLMGPIRVLTEGLFFTSWLVELHIAASVVAATLHAPQTLVRLGRGLPVVWLLAAAYLAVAVIVAGGKYELIHEHNIFGAVIVVVIFFVTLGLHLVAVVLSRRRSPSSVVRRMRERAMVYPAIFIVTVFPTCLRYMDVKAFAPCTPLGVYSHILQHATVTFNALAFCMLSGTPQVTSHAEVELGATNSGAARGSRKESTCNVGFMSNVDIVDVTHGGSWRVHGQWKDRTGSLDLEVATASAESGCALQPNDVDATWKTYVGEAHEYGWV